MDWKKYLWIGAAVLAALIILPQIVKARRKRKEMQRQAEDRLREEALDRVLVGGKETKGGGTSPYDVKYDQEQRKKEKKKISESSDTKFPVMLQLTEQTELSTRKYMFHVTDRVTFGSRPAGNDILIMGPRIAEHQCEIFRLSGELYVKNIGTEKLVVLKRKKKQVAVEQDAVRLKNKDVLQIGNFVYTVEILKS